MEKNKNQKTGKKTVAATKGKKKSSALVAASTARSATDQVLQTDHSLTNNGTNVSYGDI